MKGQDDYSVIWVGEDRIGLRGLKGALEEVAQSSGSKTDEEVAEILLEKLSHQNYIANCARKDYRKAFLREYRKFLGQAAEEVGPKRLTVKVLGPGCTQCHRLDQLVKQVLAEMGLPAEVDHVTDLKEIAAYGIVSTPALVINDKIVAKGTVPSPRKLKELLTAAQL